MTMPSCIDLKLLDGKLIDDSEYALYLEVPVKEDITHLEKV